MNFRQLVKTVDTTNFYIKELNPVDLKAQYNPERFHMWKSLHTANNKDYLNMLYSPHLKFLNDNNDDTYFRLQRLFGRNKKWIDEKIKKFLGVCQSIKEVGITDNIMVIQRPIVDNKFNTGYEIFEGHHRVSCALYLNIKSVQCVVIRR